MANRNKELGTALENRVVEKAEEHGLTARRQPGSGMFAAYPEDDVVENLLVQAKVQSAHLDAKGEKCLTLRLGWLKQVEEAAAKHGFDAGVVVVRPKGSARLLVLCDGDFFLDLLARSLGKSPKQG